MGGLFGVASKEECAKALVQGTLPIEDLFYGTDYHSHLGTMRGGLATKNSEGFTKFIHDITNTQFRSKFEDDIKKMSGNLGIGVISDTNSQPLEIDSSLGTFTIATVGKIYNIDQLKEKALKNKTIFTETNRGIINPTELIAKLIGQQENFEDGIKYAQESIEGSCSLLLLTDKGIYAARDKLGRTPLITGKKQNSFAVTSETTAFPNIGFKIENYLGPGEIVLITPEQIEQKSESLDKMQICSFLWVYYGFPSSNYESINVETTRYKCGAALARADKKAGFNFDEIDLVAGIPDSGTAHAIGYAIESGIPFKRPLVKYTPTWPRSFMPQDQKTRDLIAKMKLLPIKELIQKSKNTFL